MFGKLAVFGIGYLIGARAGRQRYEELVGGVRDFVKGEEVTTAMGFMRGALWILRQRGRGVSRRQML
ncbi:MAG: hypothetical protein M3075_08290 [Candidatus Dormibacteraeota bacterium]|jgi:hypothetical protein|nr:hypothetical protein [Candidatus Dormibacteraeota bacterium]